ncbi:MAG: hypothetical protein KF709_02380 [Gemmatimonadaceae bacterium]|nr:hypothetical protein [Gemmatimonadaceae bacterium]
MTRCIVRSRQLRTMLAMTALAVFASACKETVDDHPEVDAMRITLTGQAPVLVNSSGVASASLALTQGVTTGLTVEFLDATLQDALVGHADEFQVNVTPDAGITFARTGPFAGTLTATATGDIVVNVAMFHIEDGEEEFGPFPVTITVNPPPTLR